MKLTKKGYIISKKEQEKCIQFKKKLNVKPYLPDSVPIQQKIMNKPFKIYKESENHLYIPKFFGIKELGKVPSQERKGDEINVEFNGTLRSNQKEIIEKSIEKYHEIGGGILSLPCGFGKTTIALYLLSKMKRKSSKNCIKIYSSRSYFLSRRKKT